VAQHRTELPHVLPRAPQVVGDDHAVRACVLHDRVAAEVERLLHERAPCRVHHRTDQDEGGHDVRVAASGLDDDLGAHRLTDEHEVPGAARTDGRDDEVPEFLDVE